MVAVFYLNQISFSFMFFVVLDCRCVSFLSTIHLLKRRLMIKVRFFGVTNASNKFINQE